MKVSKGVIQDRGFAVLVYGDGGVGKSTFASYMPSPIFLDLDRSGTSMLDVERALNDSDNPIETWEEVKGTIDWLLEHRGEHKYKTVVIDTVDAMERVVHEYLCKKGNVETIEDYEKGYGKGHSATLDELRGLFTRISSLQSLGVNVCFVGHKKVAQVKNPEGKDWERIEPKCNGKISGFLMETLDAVLYVGHNVIFDTTKDGRRTKALASTRVVYTETSSSHFAKNRYLLPEQMRLEWSDFKFHMNMTPEGLAKRVDFKLKEMADGKVLKPEVEAKARLSLETNKADVQKLKNTLQWLITQDK